MTATRRYGADAMDHSRHTGEVPAELVLIAFGLVMATLVRVQSPLLGIEQLRLPKELAVLVITFVAAAIALRRTERWRVERVVVLGAACVAWSVVSLLVRAHNVWLGWRIVGGYWCAFLVYAIVRQHAHRAPARALLIVSVACAGAAVALTTLLEHYGLVAGNSLVHRAPSGVFGHRNHAAHFVALSLPAALALLRLDARRGAREALPDRLARVLGFGCAALGGAAIVVTRSRATWLAVGAAAVLVMITLLRERPVTPAAAVSPGSTGRWSHRHAGGAWLLALAIGALLGAALPSSLAWRSSLLTSASRITDFEEGSGRGRLVQYSTTLSMARANPLFGVGPGNWAVEYPRFASTGDPNIIAGASPTGRLPLSDWLGTLSESGVPVALGIVFLAVLVAVPALEGVRRASASRGIRTGDVALLVLLAEVLVLGSLDAVVQNALPAVFVATLIAVLARRGQAAAVVWPSRRARWGVRALVLAASGVLVLLAGRRLTAAVQYGSDPAPASFRAAAAIDPTDFTAQFFSGYWYVQARDCDSAVPYLRAARALHPYARSVETLARRCRAARPRIQRVSAGPA